MSSRGCLGALCLLVALVPMGCGGGADDSSARSSVVVYSSLPLRGPQSANAAAASNGMRLALRVAGGRAGKVRVRYRSLDDSAPTTGAPGAGAPDTNAREAARDDAAVAYIGELDRGSPTSIPVSNEGGIAQVGIADTAVGLTVDEPGAAEGEPDVYYPVAERTFVRIVPRDTVQATALVSLAKRSGCTQLVVANDGTPFGIGLARALRGAAEAQEVGVALDVKVDARTRASSSRPKEARILGADCFVFAGLPGDVATRAFEAYGAALPEANLFGPDRLADEAFTDAGAGGVRASTARRISLTVGTAAPDFPATARTFIRRYKRAYGDDPPASALYGYEAMSLVLDAIGRSGGGDRADVVRALFDTRDRESVLGSYSIDRDGDTTNSTYGVGSIVGGALEVGRTISGQVAK